VKLIDGRPDLYAQWEETIAFRLFSDAGQRTLSVPEQIAAKVADWILEGTLRPGAKIIEQDLAIEFAVSRGPVRDALRVLEREGLVTILARRGANVTELTVEEVKDIFEIRAALYEIVARKAVKARNDELLGVLDAGLKRLKHFAEIDNDEGRYAETAYRLFMITAKYTGNRRLYRMIQALSLQTLRYSKLGLRSKQRRQRSVKLWNEALQALRRGDSERYLSLGRQRVSESGDEAAKQLTLDERLPVRADK
jgi:DNA-binding GntR family transcriptional regulator